MLALEHRARVRSCFADLGWAQDDLVPRFYERLFSLEPSLRDLFPDNMVPLQRKLMKTLVLLVGSLDTLEALLPQLRQLGASHVEFGVVDAHYGVVGQALLDTLAEMVTHWAPEDEEAWGALFVIVQNTMLEGTQGLRAAG